MNRREFLKGMLALPAIPLVGLIVEPAWEEDSTPIGTYKTRYPRTSNLSEEQLEFLMRQVWDNHALTSHPRGFHASL